MQNALLTKGKSLEMSKFKEILKTKKIKVVILIALLITIGSLFQAGMSYKELAMYAPPGKLIDIDGHKMHLYAAGTGSPSVLLTTGSGTPCAYTDYFFIQQDLQKTTRTISYDRPGFGWSEPTDIPRTIDNQVNDLHALLNKAGEKPPYVLVGHSLASLEVIRFAQVYPDEVAGIVLIDGGNPSFYAEYNERSALTLNISFSFIKNTGLARAFGSLGLFPPIVGQNERYSHLPKEIRRIDKSMFYNTLGNKYNRNSLKNINENAKKVIKGGTLGKLPLIILTAGKDRKWIASQMELKVWSIDSKQKFIRNATHSIHWSAPDIVLDSIKELLGVQPAATAGS